MKSVIVGMIFLLSLVLGTASYIEALDLNKEMKQKEMKTGDIGVFFTALFETSKKINWRQWGMIVVAALVCAVTAYRLLKINLVVMDFFSYMVVALLLIPVMIIDWYKYSISNKIVLIFMGVGAILLFFEFIFYRESFIDALLMRVCGLIGCVVLFYIMARLTKDGIGMGDVKLIAAMGWVLGFSTTMAVVLFSLCFCTVASMVLILGKKKHKNDLIPFGPFMFLGYIFMLIFF